MVGPAKNNVPSAKPYVTPNDLIAHPVVGFLEKKKTKILNVAREVRTKKWDGHQIGGISNYNSPN